MADTKVCGHCGEDIAGSHPNRRYCSITCRYTHDLNTNRARDTKYRRENNRRFKVANGDVLAPETPIIYYNYKEPLRPFKGGFGFIGVLAGNEKRTHVQCHLCGYLYKFLAPHLVSKHGIRASEYKEKVGLMQKTALVGEESREKRIAARSTERWQEIREQARESIVQFNLEVTQGLRPVSDSKKHHHWVLEKRNIDGLCPDQLLEKIKDMATKLGRTPTQADFRKAGGRYLGSISYTFGSWTNAVRMAGMIPKSDLLADKHSPGMLLDYLRTFHQEHGRNATESDFKRGLLPSRSVYYRVFGTLDEARRAAGLPTHKRMSA